MEKKINRKIKVGKLQFKSKNLFEIDALIEIDMTYKTPRDIVFLNMLENMSKSNYISMQMQAFDLRCIINALRDLMENEKTAYEKITRSDNIISKIYFDMKIGTKDDIKIKTYWINLKRDNKVLSLSMGPIGIRSLIEQCSVLVLKLEERLFKEQEAYYSAVNNKGTSHE